MAKLRFVLLLALLCGCRESGPPSGKTADSKPVPPASFVMLWTDPTSLDPILVSDTFSSNIVCQLFDGLVAVDSGLVLTPELADSWTVSPDGREYNFQLREGIRFHDGSPITADDFVRSFLRMLAPGTGEESIGREYISEIQGASDYMAGRASSVKGLRAIDDRHLSIRLASPDTRFLAAMAMPNFKVVPAGASDAAFWRKPIGSGPYKFESWKHGHSIRLAANHEYWAGRPKIETLEFRTHAMPSAHDLVEMFRAGKLQLMVGMGDDSEFLAREGYTILKCIELSLHYIGFNCKMPPFDDARVRRAVASSIRYERLAIAEPLSYTPASGIIPPGLAGYRRGSRPFPHDPVGATKLLGEAGYESGRIGAEVDFYTYSEGVGAGARAEELIAEDLLNIGLSLKTKRVQWDEYTRILAEHKMPIFRMAWVADVPDTSSILSSLFFSRALNNQFSYSKDEVDRLLQRARAELEPGRKSELYRSAEEAILNDVPIIPLDYGSAIYIVQPYVKGLNLSPYGLADVAMEKVSYEQ